jgi:two-component system OmpR family response regulator
MENNITHNILLAEDDPSFGNVLKMYLEAKGFRVFHAANGEEALKVFYSKENFSLVLLDIMMPKKDGFQIAQELRNKSYNIPIIFITAKSLQEDILQGFKHGADDYITKPFTMEELLARMQAVISRTFKDDSFQQRESAVYEIGEYVFEYSRQVLRYYKQEKKLTAREADLLKLLCNYANQILDRKIALEVIWGEDNYFHARNMDVYISKIRKYLSEDKDIELINVHGVGYKLIIPQK